MICVLQVATFKPPVGVDRMERASKRAALAPGVRRWFRFDKAGHSSVITADKHAIAQQTGVQVHSSKTLGRRKQGSAAGKQCRILQAP